MSDDEPKAVITVWASSTQVGIEVNGLDNIPISSAVKMISQLTAGQLNDLMLIAIANCGMSEKKDLTYTAIIDAWARKLERPLVRPSQVLQGNLTQP